MNKKLYLQGFSVFLLLETGLKPNINYSGKVILIKKTTFSFQKHPT